MIDCFWLPVFLLTRKSLLVLVLVSVGLRSSPGKMTEPQQGADFDAISFHNFSEKILEQVVHFHVMKLSGGFFLWVGSSPVLSNLAVSLSSKYDSLSTLVIGDPSNTAPSSLAQRLAKKTKKQVFVSYSLPVTDSNLSLLVENRIKKELELHPEHF